MQQPQRNPLVIEESRHRIFAYILSQVARLYQEQPDLNAYELKRASLKTLPEFLSTRSKDNLFFRGSSPIPKEAIFTQEGETFFDRLTEEGQIRFVWQYVGLPLGDLNVLDAPLSDETAQMPAMSQYLSTPREIKLRRLYPIGEQFIKQASNCTDKQALGRLIETFHQRARSIGLEEIAPDKISDFEEWVFECFWKAAAQNPPVYLAAQTCALTEAVEGMGLFGQVLSEMPIGSFDQALMSHLSSTEIQRNPETALNRIALWNDYPKTLLSVAMMKQYGVLHLARLPNEAQLLQNLDAALLRVFSRPDVSDCLARFDWYTHNTEFCKNKALSHTRRMQFEWFNRLMTEHDAQSALDLRYLMIASWEPLAEGYTQKILEKHMSALPAESMDQECHRLYKMVKKHHIKEQAWDKEVEILRARMQHKESLKKPLQVTPQSISAPPVKPKRI